MGAFLIRDYLNRERTILTPLRITTSESEDFFLAFTEPRKTQTTLSRGTTTLTYWNTTTTQFSPLSKKQEGHRTSHNTQRTCYGTTSIIRSEGPRWRFVRFVEAKKLCKLLKHSKTVPLKEQQVNQRPLRL